MVKMSDKKRHHFIARAYLLPFCDGGGTVCVYSKDKNGKCWTSLPEAIAFENYYYSQPTLDGGQDNQKLEDAFGKIESEWTPFVRKIERREGFDGILKTLLTFVLMHRVRVPATRNIVEKVLAESVKMTTRYLHEEGQLPPLPSGLDFDYLESITIFRSTPTKQFMR